MDPLIVAVAPNGARKTKIDHPALPVGPAALAETASSCLEAGACMIHLHVRDETGAHTLDPGRYRDAISAVRKVVGERLIIQVTTEACGIYSAAEQMAVVRELRPEAVSLALAEIIPTQAYEMEAARFLDWLRRERFHPQYILYSPDDVARFADLRRRGVVPGSKPSVLFVLGRYTTTMQSSPVDLQPFLDAARGQSITWAVCAFGRREAACMAAAVSLGGHVRVGFENNLHLPDGSLAPDNAALVSAVVTTTDSFGRNLASADEARGILYRD